MPNAPPENVSFAPILRRRILEQALDSNVGHIGSALSVVELISVLWTQIMRHPGSAHVDRDRFILSKGHAALALYALLRTVDLIDQATFETYCKDDSLLGVHPEHGLPGVEVGTGSLGQGLSVGCGLALALARRGSPARVFVLLSDAECNEGQIWEAAMFAAHHRLSNLIALVDVNGMQALGPTREVLDLAPLAARWQAFGWQTLDVDGHDESALHAALTGGLTARRGPVVVVAHTVLGRGVSFMEQRLEWHYRNLTTELANRALAEAKSRS